MSDKPGFLMAHETCRALDCLPDGELRAMLRAMCEYSENGVDPEFDNQYVRMMWLMISRNTAMTMNQLSSREPMLK